MIKLAKGAVIAVLACAAALAPPSLGAAGAAPLTPEQEAVERSAILNLMGWTMVAFDNGDRASFLTAFADNGTFRVIQDPAPGVFMTKAQMIQRWLSLEPRAEGSGAAAASGSPAAAPDGRRYQASQHFTSNLSVLFKDATHARLFGYEMRVQMTEGVGDDKLRHVTGMGSYDISLVKQNGKWLFESYTLIHAGNGRKAPLEH
jgi:hypothetical protein